MSNQNNHQDDKLQGDKLQGLGDFIREQRRLANLSLRKMADLAQISNPYLSQLERGLHEPSVRVLQSIAKALNLSAETLLEQAGLLEHHDPVDGAVPDTEAAIRADRRLTEHQKLALLSVYRTYATGNVAEQPAPQAEAQG